jgi:DNA-binding transcriptional LysR family regulator
VSLSWNERRGGSTLTPAGMAVSEWASHLLALADGMDARLTALRSDAQTTLRVAASLTIAEYLLPCCLFALQASRVRKDQPQVAAELTVVNSSAVASQVAGGGRTSGS